MADLDNEPLVRTALPHDGEARCRVCTCADAEARHDWCTTVSGLVCEECCHRILLGDIGRLMSAAMGGPAPDDAAPTCAECERGQRWVAGHVLGALRHGGRPS